MTGIHMMMLGAKAVVDHTVSAVPTPMGATLGNGVAYSQNCTANVANGVGPFTYSWSFISNNFGFSLVNATSATVTVQQGGQNNAVREFQIQCAVTDTGNGNLVKNSNVVPGSVTWGTPP